MTSFIIFNSGSERISANDGSTIDPGSCVGYSLDNPSSLLLTADDPSMISVTNSNDRYDTDGNFISSGDSSPAIIITGGDSKQLASLHNNQIKIIDVNGTITVSVAP